MENSLSVIIPSRNEKFLQKTILDVLQNSRGQIEIIAVLDGYEPPQEELVLDERVKYLRLPETTYLKKRHAINAAVQIAEGKYVMALDGHCLVAPGFDLVLERDYEEGTIEFLRRHRLDPIVWDLQPQCDKRPPIDYEYIMFPGKFEYPAFHGFKWDKRTLERENIMIDEICEAQGSMWFMSKEFFKRMGFMQTEGYTGWGGEAEELIFSTYRAGGRALVNKNSYYAHLHKGKVFGRMYFMDKRDLRKSYEYVYHYWAIENKDFFISFINKFGPLPGWPKDWQKQLYSN